MPRLPALSDIRSALSQGLGPTAAYNQYRDRINALKEADPGAGWVGQRTQDYFRLYGQLNNIRQDVGAALDAPKDIPGGGLTPRPWSTEDGSGYGHWVGVSQVERDSGLPVQTRFLIKSDTLLTPQEAEQRVSDFLDTQPDTYNRRTIAIYFTGLTQFQPRDVTYE